ncbi:hypothetical protein HYR99_35865 [Candidatus Poribacteria bacterium]|nr:hypothetical protein [Candidatus Poribacteria bacterium]
MKTNKPIFYTSAAKERMEKLRREIEAEIEAVLCDQKYVPGDEQIEVTGSDVEDLARSMRIEFYGRHERRRFLREQIVRLYLITGVITTLAGLFYSYTRSLIENPVQFTLVLAGIMMIIGSYIMSVYLWRFKHLRLFEGQFRKRIDEGPATEGRKRESVVD